jgi:hypothetical protein
LITRTSKVTPSAFGETSQTSPVGAMLEAAALCIAKRTYAHPTTPSKLVGPRSKPGYAGLTCFDKKLRGIMTLSASENDSDLSSHTFFALLYTLHQ